MTNNFPSFQVHICSSFILNGVCCRWRGWLDLEKLEGVGSLELDLEMVAREEQLLQRQLALVQQRLRECEELYRGDYNTVSETERPVLLSGGCSHCVRRKSEICHVTKIFIAR